MDISFYVLMSVLACLSLINLLNARRSQQSRARTFGMWFNGLAISLIVVALIIAILIK